MASASYQPSGFASPNVTGDIAEIEPFAVEIGLNAAIVTVTGGGPQILTVRPDIIAARPRPALPFGLFTPLKHRTLEIGLRDWVKDQTALDLGYVEQLYTFGDRGRHALPHDRGLHVVSIGYLALTKETVSASQSVSWQSWYSHFPWEDWRNGKPEILTRDIEPRLDAWAKLSERRGSPARAFGRPDRLRICFGHSVPWDDEKVLERYELLYEAGLVEEAHADGRDSARAWGEELPRLGAAMAHDHRRILATAMSRLRAKLKYRPLIFELMPAVFTLLELQRVVEALLGSFLHKQNFRRLIDAGGLVEATGRMSPPTGGRPARLYRFRSSVLLERPTPGLRVRVQKGARTSRGK